LDLLDFAEHVGAFGGFSVHKDFFLPHVGPVGFFGGFGRMDGARPSQMAGDGGYHLRRIFPFGMACFGVFKGIGLNFPN